MLCLGPLQRERLAIRVLGRAARRSEKFGESCAWRWCLAVQLGRGAHVVGRLVALCCAHARHAFHVLERGAVPAYKIGVEEGEGDECEAELRE